MADQTIQEQARALVAMIGDLLDPATNLAAAVSDPGNYRVPENYRLIDRITHDNLQRHDRAYHRIIGNGNQDVDSLGRTRVEQLFGTDWTIARVLHRVARFEAVIDLLLAELDRRDQAVIDAQDDLAHSQTIRDRLSATFAEQSDKARTISTERDQAKASVERLTAQLAVQSDTLTEARARITELESRAPTPLQDALTSDYLTRITEFIGDPANLTRADQLNGSTGTLAGLLHRLDTMSTDIDRLRTNGLDTAVTMTETEHDRLVTAYGVDARVTDALAHIDRLQTRLTDHGITDPEPTAVQELQLAPDLERDHHRITELQRNPPTTPATTPTENTVTPPETQPDEGLYGGTHPQSN